MEIERKLNKKGSTRPAFLDEDFSITMSGEELLRLWLLSYRSEGGDHHSTDPDVRFNKIIEEFLDFDSSQMESYANRLDHGEYRS
jgi:hypothetical protein